MPPRTSPTATLPVTHKDFLVNWLAASPGQQYAKFSCTTLVEVASSRPRIAKALSEAVFVHHNDPGIYRQKLKHLGYPATADALDRRPKSTKTRMGNFGEVVASEFLRQIRGYDIPVYRLRYNANDESSPKGDDVLAFEFADKAKRTKDTVIVAEVKVRSTFRSDAVDEAHDSLSTGKRPRPKSFSFVVDVLFREGREAEAKRLLDLSNKFGKRSLVRRSLLFLITGNTPSAPFDILDGKSRIAPGLEGLHLSLAQLSDLVTNSFEAQIDATAL